MDYDDFDDEAHDLRQQRNILRRNIRQRTEHWHPQDPDYIEDEEDED